jgi:lipooligosaccharide transport system permease protein
MTAGADNYVRAPAGRVLGLLAQLLAWRPGALAVRQCRFWLTDYRRTWKGSIYSSVFNPLLYLGAMGLGLGTLVDRHGTAHLGGVNYLTFLAPGLLAAQAMQTGIGECTYPVLGSVKWNNTYQAAAASPLRPGDIFHGHQLFVTMRLLMNSGIFLAVMAAFGAVRTPAVILALPAAVLTGLAFAAPVEAWAITRDKDSGFSVLFRFVMIPLFLFSGTFFPITQLPGWVRPVAYITPLWHGVALCRGISLGTLTTGDAFLHVGYLIAFMAAGLAVGQWTHRRRLHA